MIFGKEQIVTPEEPLVLGVVIDPERAALYDEFAKGRSLDDVYRLWIDPAVTDPTIRQRAVAVLSAPQGYDVPYPHPDQSVGRLLNITEEVDGNATCSLRKRLKGRPELAQELTQGLLYWLKKTDGHTSGSNLNSRYDYQSAIKHLLPIVDEASADELFAYYPSNDIESYQNMDDASGYQPIISLLYDKEIPRKYKDSKLAEWFDIAEREEQGGAQPREEYERAIKKLAGFLETWTYGELVDDDISTTIVRFLENNTPVGVAYVEGFAARRVADHIIDEDVKFAFAWRHIVVDSDRNWGQFRVDDDKDLALLEWTKEEAHKRGLTQFDAKAEVLVREYEIKRRKRAAAQLAELALQAKLRS